jgi:hypothetical protein
MGGNQLLLQRFLREREDFEIEGEIVIARLAAGGTRTSKCPDLANRRQIAAEIPRFITVDRRPRV